MSTTTVVKQSKDRVLEMKRAIKKGICPFCAEPNMVQYIDKRDNEPVQHCIHCDAVYANKDWK